MALVVILIAWGAPDESINRLGDLAGYLDGHNTAAAKLIVTFGGLILVLFAVLIVIFEVSPPEGKILRVGSGGGRIGTEEVAHRLEYEVGALPQVGHVQATVVARGQKAEVNLELHVAPATGLAVAAEEACRLARRIVEEEMSVALARPPQAQLHYRELPAGYTPPAAVPAVSAETPHEAADARQEDRPTGV